MVDTLDTAADFGPHINDRSVEHRPDPEIPVPIGRLGDDFAAMLEDWHRLSVAINALSRSTGAEDPYPFVITRAVEEKLAFVHRIITRTRHAAAC